MSGGHEEDLPLLANTADIQVIHQVLDLECSLKNQTFSGSIILILKPVCHSKVNGIYSNYEYQKFVKETSCGNVLQSKTFEKEEAHEVSITSPDNILINRRLTTQCSSQNTKNASIGYSNSPIVNSTGSHEKVKLTCIDNLDSQTYYSSSGVGSPIQLFHLILDACDLDITSVEELGVTDHVFDQIYEQLVLNQFLNIKETLSLIKRCPLKFRVDKWKIEIWKEEVREAQCFPLVVKINYRTKSQGQSIIWTKDQNQKQVILFFLALLDGFLSLDEF